MLKTELKILIPLFNMWEYQQWCKTVYIKSGVHLIHRIFRNLTSLMYRNNKYHVVFFYSFFRFFNQSQILKNIENLRLIVAVSDPSDKSFADSFYQD